MEINLLHTNRNFTEMQLEKQTCAQCAIYVQRTLGALANILFMKDILGTGRNYYLYFILLKSEFLLCKLLSHTKENVN